MKVVVLMENTPSSWEFLTEHGFSLYLETEKHKILFDMGQSDAYLRNAQRLGVDLTQVDIAVLSHGHYDHGGGLEAFLEKNHQAKVYINQNAFGDFYARDGRYLGLKKELEHHPRVVLTPDAWEIDEELFLFTGNHEVRQYEMDTFGLFRKEGENLIPDDFSHEQYLLIREKEKTVLISGCSHKGILNIMDWVKQEEVSEVYGGFHYMKLDLRKDADYLRISGEKLLEYPATYYTGHCTGLPQYEALKKRMGERLQYLSSGTIIQE